MKIFIQSHWILVMFKIIWKFSGKVFPDWGINKSRFFPIFLPLSCNAAPLKFSILVSSIFFNINLLNDITFKMKPKTQQKIQFLNRSCLLVTVTWRSEEIINFFKVKWFESDSLDGLHLGKLQNLLQILD